MSTTDPAYGQRVAAAVGKWEEEERVRIAGFGVEKLEGSRKESVSQRRSRSSEVPSSGERMRSKSRDDRKDSRNLDLRKEHDEMRARNQVERGRILSTFSLIGGEKVHSLRKSCDTGTTLRSRAHY